jgi:ankyrin repeat protein
MKRVRKNAGALALAVLCGGAWLRVALAGAWMPPTLAFDDKGALAGERLPDLRLRTVDDEPVSLHDRLTAPVNVIVTSSFTCPKSRAHYPEVAALAEKYKGKVAFVILYVIEAHPSGDPSPYRDGKEDVTAENERDRILRRQPRTFDKRLALANEFQARLGVKVPIVVDPMDNWAWRSVGGGPNMAVVTDRQGRVLARQGWVDGKTLDELVAKAVEATGERKDGYVSATDAALMKELEARGIKETFQLVAMMADDQAAAFEKLLEQYPGLATLTLRTGEKGTHAGKTLLQVAADANYLPAAKALLARGADPAHEERVGGSALALAAAAGHDDMLRLLLAHGKGGEGGQNVLREALQQAVVHHRLATAALLRTAGAAETFYTRVAQGDRAAVTAALANDPSLAGRPDGAGNTPLTYAAAAGRAEMVTLLVERAGVPLGRVADEAGALAAAVQFDRPEAVAAVLAAGADVNGVLPPSASPAIHWAVADKNARILKVLLAAGAKVNLQDGLGRTPLHVAAAAGDVDTMGLLVAAGADVEARVGVNTMPCGPGGLPSEATPLAFAAEGGHLAAVRFLLERGASPAADRLGRTPLHVVVSPSDDYAGQPVPADRQVAVAGALVAKVPANAEDQEGRTALDLALSQHNDAVAAVLKAAGGKPGSGLPPSLREKADGPKKVPR